MADHGKVEYATATGNDLPVHQETYRNFLRLVKWMTVTIAVGLVLMAIFLTGH